MESKSRDNKRSKKVQGYKREEPTKRRERNGDAAIKMSKGKGIA